MQFLLSATRAATRCQRLLSSFHFEYKSHSTASQALRSQGPIRTRFAPSPTGFLHLGSLRTALFNFLVAKATGGQFLLRIEDTDQKRTIQGAEERLFEDLKWAGLQWDEGPQIGGPCGPYRQSQRTALYREYTERLLNSKNAYRCFCTSERLHTLAHHRSKLGLPPDYDRACAHIPTEESNDRASRGEAHVVRLKVPDKYPVYNDLVYGLVRQRNDTKAKGRNQTSFDDPILLKSDGFPTYHLANVVDDHLMKITHVIRGSEWMSSTPKHLAIYQAFDWKPPAFAHVGLLLDQNKQKLSKRTGSIDIATWRNNGIFPETLTNFVALLGWSHNEKQDIMNMEELIKNASMKFTKGDTVVSFEKLWFLQKRHAGRYASPAPSKSSDAPHELEHLAVQPTVGLLDQLSETGEVPVYNCIPKGSKRLEYVRSILWVDALNYTNPRGFIDRNMYFFVTPTAENLRAELPALKLHGVPQVVTQAVPSEALLGFANTLTEIQDGHWTLEEIKKIINLFIDKGVDMSKEEVKELDAESTQLSTSLAKAWSKVTHQYLRWAISVGQPGPDSAVVMGILGRKETLARLNKARAVLEKAKE